MELKNGKKERYKGKKNGLCEKTCKKGENVDITIDRATWKEKIYCTDFK